MSLPAHTPWAARMLAFVARGEGPATVRMLLPREERRVVYRALLA